MLVTDGLEFPDNIFAAAQTSANGSSAVHGARWTEEEVARLRSVASSHTVSELAEMFERTTRAVIMKCFKDGIKYKSVKGWTAEEDAYLREAYPKSKARQMAEHLGRTTKAVQDHLEGMGLTTKLNRSSSPTIDEDGTPLSMEEQIIRKHEREVAAAWDSHGPLTVKTVPLALGKEMPESYRPAPESELTEDQRHIRQLEDQLARVQGQKDPELEYVVAAEDGEVIQVHFVADGFTALGKVWYRGQDLKVTVGDDRYRETVDRKGFSWLSLRADDFAQIDRWGKVFFHEGPWRGRPYRDGAGSFEELKGAQPPTVDELDEVQRLEQARQGAAPRSPGA